MIETSTVLTAASLALALTAMVLLIRGGPSSNGGTDADDQGGGGSDRVPRRPPELTSHGDPTWWPEFERELAAYVEKERVAPTSNER